MKNFYLTKHKENTNTIMEKHHVQNLHVSIYKCTYYFVCISMCNKVGNRPSLTTVTVHMQWYVINRQCFNNWSSWQVCCLVVFQGYGLLNNFITRWLHQRHPIFRPDVVTWPHYILTFRVFNTLRPRQSDCDFADDIFKCIFLNENVWISI